MKGIICDLFGHRNITFLTMQPGDAGVYVGAACLRCRLNAVGDTTIGYLIPNENEEA